MVLVKEEGEDEVFEIPGKSSKFSGKGMDYI